MEIGEDPEEECAVFKLDRYSLTQMQEAYHAYIDTAKKLKYGLDLADKYIESNKGKTVKITS
jgi:hypothetical protein